MRKCPRSLLLSGGVYAIMLHNVDQGKYRSTQGDTDLALRGVEVPYLLVDSWDVPVREHQFPTGIHPYHDIGHKDA